MILIAFIFMTSSQIIGTSNTPYLVIFPDKREKSFAIGSSFMVTCKVYGVSAQNLETRIRWHGPDGKEIIEEAGVGRHIYIMKELNRPENRLVFSRARQMDQGTYECSARVEGNIQRKSITITVFKDITFDHAPNPQFKTLHKTELLECRVSGNPVPTVEWLFKGKPIDTNQKYRQVVYGLYIKDVSREDEGVYTCQASVQESGAFDFRYIDLIVQEAALIDTSTTHFEGVQSHEFTLPCKASGKPEPRFEFFKDDNKNPVHTTFKRHFDAEGGFLTFRPLTEDDDGVYTCRAFNNAGSDTAQLKLDVVVPPSIISFTNRTGEENKPYTLSCITHAKPAANITIKKVSIRSLSDPTKYFHMGDNDGGRVKVKMLGNSELQVVFKKLKASDYCNYTCISTNKGGMHEKNATITVNFKPQFDPANVRSWYIWPGKTKNLTCLSYAEPMPLIEWIKYKSISRPIYTNRTYRVYSMGKNSNLQVTVREEDQNWIYGTYYCVVRNQYGSSNLSVELKMAELPGAPKAVRTGEVTADTVVLEVDSPENDGGLEVRGYRIDFETKVLKFYVGQEIYIEYLRPSTTFVFQVRAFTEVGDGAPLRVHVKTQNVQRPQKLVLTGGEEEGYAYKYTVHWEKPLTGGVPIKEYKFRYRRVALVSSEGLERSFRVLDGWTEVKKHDTDPQRPMRFYVLHGLKQNTYYEILVSARNDIGYSEESDPFVFKTDKDLYYGVSEPEPDNSQNSLHATHLSVLITLLCLVCCSAANLI